MLENNNFIDIEKIYGKDYIEKWTKKYKIFTNPEVKKWIEDKIEKYSRPGKDPQKFKIVSYLLELQRYCDFNKCEDPAELLKEPLDERNKRLMNYLTTLLKEGKNATTIHNKIQSILKSFYSSRGSSLTVGLEAKKSGINRNEIILDRETIKKLLTKLERPEYRLILKFQALTGLRISDIINQLEKYKLQTFEGYHYIKNFTTQKENVVINYLFFPKELSILITSVFGNENIKFITRHGTLIKKHDYLQRLKEIGEKLGIKENIKTHSFRKFFSSQVRRVREVDVEFKEHLMGHQGQNLSQSYNNNLQDIHWFFEQWKKLEPAIVIDTEIIDNTSEEVLILKEEMAKKDRQIFQVKTLMNKIIQIMNIENKTTLDDLLHDPFVAELNEKP